MPTMNPYIHFNGNAEEAFMFYKSVFGGEFSALRRFNELSNPDISFPENEANKIMHIGISIGENHVLMGSDVPEMFGKVNENENRSKIFINTESKEEADRIFQGLSSEGQVEMPIGDSPWGTYFGMLRDKYGIEWMIEFKS